MRKDVIGIVVLLLCVVMAVSPCVATTDDEIIGFARGIIAMDHPSTFVWAEIDNDTLVIGKDRKTADTAAFTAGRSTGKEKPKTIDEWAKVLGVSEREVNTGLIADYYYDKLATTYDRLRLCDIGHDLENLAELADPIIREYPDRFKTIELVLFTPDGDHIVARTEIVVMPVEVEL